MEKGAVVHEQRLHTTGLAVVLGLAFVMFINIGILIDSADNSPSTPVVALLVGSAVALLLGVLALLASRILVQVTAVAGGRQLEIRYGPGGHLRQVLSPDSIESVRQIKLSALQTGGWGYRGSLKFLHRAALVTRRGEALEVTLSKGRRFVVTVDNPGEFVDALQMIG
jgi:hypothetical protein